ncbi:MAG TPA: response regulator [Calditrichia bacterium]|nr:response regulator [Calditrichota bacterium]HQV32877.1 response regulator [Calditrichia bacterium]
MDRKFNFLLIDDNSADNFYHKIVIDNTSLAASVLDFQYAEKALKYFRESEDPPADIVFLDINMPRMSGFEFMSFFRDLPEQIIKKTKIIMLTTSLNPADRDKAGSMADIISFKNKPLREEDVYEIVRDHYSDLN